MSYQQAMKHWKNPRKGKKSQPMVFSTGGSEDPWLGGVWFQPGMDEKREQFIKDWKAGKYR